MKLFFAYDAPNYRNFVPKFENVENLSVAPISQLYCKVQITVIFRVVMSKGVAPISQLSYKVQITVILGSVVSKGVAPISQLYYKVQITVIFRVCRVQRCSTD